MSGGDGQRGPGAHVRICQHFLLRNGLGQCRANFERIQLSVTRSQSKCETIQRASFFRAALGRSRQKSAAAAGNIGE